MYLSVCACVRACVRACVCVCVQAYIHVDDRLVGTVDGGELGIGATGVEGQQRRRVAGVWTGVPSVVPCRAQRPCTVATKNGVRNKPFCARCEQANVLLSEPVQQRFAMRPYYD